MPANNPHPDSVGDVAERSAATLRVDSLPIEELRALACELHACQSGLQSQNDELRRAYRALEDSLDNYQELFDRAPVGYLTLVPECEIREANRAAAELFGVEQSALIGAAFADFVSPKDAAEFKQHMNCVCYERGAQSQEVEFVRSPGGVFTARLESVAVRDSSGQLRQCRMAMVDVTERVRAQTDLQHSERLLRTIIDAAGEAMISVDAGGTIALFNSAAECLFGYRPETVVGTPMEHLISERCRADVLERLGDSVAERGSNQCVKSVCETTGLRRDGAEFPLELSRAAGRGEDGPFVVVVARDLTERKLAERRRREIDARIQEAQKLESLGTLAGGVAHDFSNLLVGVLGNASLAMDTLPPDSSAWKLLERIERAARDAADLTKQLLAYSGRGSFVVAPIDLSSVVRDMTHLLRSSVSRKATLRFDLAADGVLTTADAPQMRQIVVNLVTNASEALDEASGTISISTGTADVDSDRLNAALLGDGPTPGEYAFLTVADTGHGMDDDTKARVFEPFFTTKFTGRGLGLAAVMGITRSHGGAIEVESEIGKGTTVTVLFPRCEAIVVSPEVAAPTKQPAIRGRILVIDDEETVRVVAEETLLREGYAVCCASDGREGLERFQEDSNGFDAVILDVTMPELDGVEALREIRRCRADIPVILSSGYDPSGIEDRLGAAKPSAFIQKPYMPAALLEQLRAVLSR